MRTSPLLVLLLMLSLSLTLSLMLAACDDGGTEAAADARPTDAEADGAPRADRGVPDAVARADGAAMDAAVDATVSDAAVDGAAPDAALPGVGLIINELMPSNDGAWIDEAGEIDDWVELYNGGPDPVNLMDYSLSDRLDEPHALPDFALAPGDVVVLWADDALEQGPLHLPFKLSAAGETVFLWDPNGDLRDTFVFPAAEANEAFARLPDGVGPVERCGWATAGMVNGATCGPPPPPSLEPEVDFDPYTWADPWPFPPTPLALSEVALRPAGFVELINVTDAPVDLATFSLRLSTIAPGMPWPTRAEGVVLALPAAMLPAGDRIVVQVTVEDTAALEADPAFEGVLQLWAEDREFPVERVDFMRWPEGAALTRVPDATGRHRFCGATTPGAANDPCDPLATRAVGDRLRHLRTPGDFAALADGDFATGIQSVKVVLDLQGGDAVHLLSSRTWDLHFRFVSEIIDQQPHLDRCDAEENRVFYAGWSAFSDINYRQVEGRRYLLGTLQHHGGADLWTVEFAAGDTISAAQMRRAFFGAVAHADEPQRFGLRPQTSDQLERARTLEGSVPLVDPNAPFRGQTYQPLTETVGYGVLTFVPVGDLDSVPLGPQVIVVTDQVPNDIALVGGLITESFQTPLAHVNLLSRNRDTPNMALVDARREARLADLFGQLVRLEVGGGDFTVEAVEGAEAEAFWEARRPNGPPLEPRLDTSVRGVVDLSTRSLADLPAVGAKAAGLAELLRVNSAQEGCPGPLALPATPTAVPVVHSLEHYEASGARALLLRLEDDAAFRTDPTARAAGLVEVRRLITEYPVDPALLAEIEGSQRGLYGTARVRFRSSSNTEDLPGFNGAGLYTSVSAALDDPDRPVADALRTVWASLYRARGYDERSYHNISQDGVAMGVLMEPAFLSERANGVGVTRNVLEPIRSDYYINVQAGEATVTNPAPGVGSEALLFSPYRPPRVRYLARSTLTGGAPVLSGAEIEDVACRLRAIHDHFRPIIDPARDDPWFAMDVEFKLVGEARRVYVKQARPYSFGSLDRPADCRAL